MVHEHCCEEGWAKTYTYSAELGFSLKSHFFYRVYAELGGTNFDKSSLLI